MIKKSVICCAIFLAFHLLFIICFPSMGVLTHQWQDNVNKAQQYVYEKSRDTVMVGTSLSSRIIADSIPMVTSLSFGGCSVEDGLRIILYKGYTPKFILIESNYILKDANTSFLSSITEGPMPMLRKWIPSLREKYEPICIYESIFDYFDFHFLGLKGYLYSRIKQNNNIDNSQKNDRLLLEIGRRKKEDMLLTPTELRSRVNNIKQLTTELEAKGSKIVFFEMPINQELAHLKKDNQTRGVLQKEFPANKYLYLPNDTAKYETTDGLHFTQDDSKKFSHYFQAVLEKHLSEHHNEE